MIKVIDISDKYNGKHDWTLIVTTECSKYEISGFSYYKEILLEQESIMSFGFDPNNYDRCFINEIK